jgi:peptide/nickel transport system substrate-binding protein
MNLSVVIAFVVVLLAFPGLCMSQEPKYGGSLVVGILADIGSIDPNLMRTAIEGRVATLMTDNLVLSNKNNEAHPGLATSWEVSEDLKQWTFHLRKGVKFHNGREMTAEDIKFNFDRIMNPKTGATFRTRLVNVGSVEVVDRYTVKVILTKPSASFIASTIFGASTQFTVIAPECVKEDGSVTNPIGTGPFEFVEWKPNEYIKVRKFKDYWVKGIPYLDEVILKPVSDETVRLTALRTGDLDMAYPLPVDEVARLMKKSQKDFYFLTGSTAGVGMIHFNMAKPPFDDLRVRQAVAYGINKDEMMTAIWHGQGEVVNQPVPKTSPWYGDVPDIVQDKKKAKELLVEAGYSKGLEVILTAANSYPYMRITAEIMQAQLKEIGMNIKLDLNDWPTTVKKIVKHEFTFGVSGIGSVVGDPGIIYPAFFSPKGGYSFLTAKAYDNPRLNELLDKADMDPDFQARKALYTEAMTILQNDVPYIFTCFGPGPWGLRSYVKGFDAQPNALFAYGGGGLKTTWLDK